VNIICIIITPSFLKEIKIRTIPEILDIAKGFMLESVVFSIEIGNSRA
jgi:hypothetical protein